MLESLHILDMSQGLHKEGGAAPSVSAPEKNKERRLPNIIEQAPAPADKQNLASKALPAGPIGDESYNLLSIIADCTP